jgi:hypothetical protein
MTDFAKRVEMASVRFGGCRLRYAKNDEGHHDR